MSGHQGPDESVQGVPRARLIDREWRGIRGAGSVDVEAVLHIIAAEAKLRPRAEAEADPSWKQVIPYLLLRDGERLFLMKRSRAGGDARLHERWSIGVGGHLGPGDADVMAGLLREFEEELAADWRPEPRLIGLLNDDSTPVGQVHLGVVFEADAAGRAVVVRETDKLSGSFVAPEEVRSGYARLETWSQLLFDYLRQGLPPEG